MRLILILFFMFICCVSAQFCNNTADCSYNGLCDTNNTCHCFDNYITHDSVSGCNYSQKKRLTAFLLEFFLGGFGAGWFYLDRLDFAIPVLVLSLVLGCCVAPYFKVLRKAHDVDELKLSCVMCCYLGMFLSILGLYLHGLIVTGMGTATDSNGVAVSKW